MQYLTFGSAGRQASVIGADTIAYAWLLRYPASMQVITGTTNPKRIASAAKAGNITLTRKEWYQIYLAAGNRLP